MTPFFWLTSYPKSGNTWMRVFIANYLGKSDTPANINHLEKSIGLNTRRHFDELLQIESSNLTPREINQLRPAYYREFARLCANEPVFVKIHDAFQHFPDGQPMFPVDAIAGIIYIIRSPLDVAVSFAHHLGRSIDHTIQAMNNPDYILAHRTYGLPTQLEQKLSTWSGHVRSWVDQPDLRKCILRYEDMIENPIESFTAMIQFTGLDVNPELIAHAVRASSFEELRKQEAEHGFREKPVGAETFFRKGKAGAWRETLTPKQVTRIVEAHEEIMARYNYLP